MYNLFLHTHLELLNSSLQALCGEAGLFGRQLILCRLKPPDEGAREAAELEQLLLTGLDGSKPVREKPRTVVGFEDGTKNSKRRKEAAIERRRRSCMKEER